MRHKFHSQTGITCEILLLANSFHCIDAHFQCNINADENFLTGLTMSANAWLLCSPDFQLILTCKFLTRMLTYNENMAHHRSFCLQEKMETVTWWLVIRRRCFFEKFSNKDALRMKTTKKFFNSKTLPKRDLRTLNQLKVVRIQILAKTLNFMIFLSQTQINSKAFLIKIYTLTRTEIGHSSSNADTNLISMIMISLM